MIETARLRLVPIGLAGFDALLAGEIERAEAALGCTGLAAWAATDAEYLAFRRDELRDQPELTPWLDRAIVLASTRAYIGHVGFHGAPDRDGVVEVGVAIEPPHRRQGYADEVIRGMLRWARAQGVPRVRASIAPANAPSRALFTRLGFVEVGVHEDPEDGLELRYERSLV